MKQLSRRIVIGTYHMILFFSYCCVVLLSDSEPKDDIVMQWLSKLRIKDAILSDRNQDVPCDTVFELCAALLLLSTVMC